MAKRSAKVTLAKQTTAIGQMQVLQSINPRQKADPKALT